MSDNEKGKQQQQESLPEYTTYKYSNKGKRLLHESILLAGFPMFIKYENGQVKIIDKIQENSRIIRPPKIYEYPYESYEFVDVNEINLYLNRAKNETLDSLYFKAKSIVQNYTDQDEDIINLLAADIVLSYFQDLFPTMHYLNFQDQGISIIAELLQRKKI